MPRVSIKKCEKNPAIEKLIHHQQTKCDRDEKKIIINKEDFVNESGDNGTTAKENK